MMYQVSKLTNEVLTAFNLANGEPFKKGGYPLAAPLEAEKPFCVYRVSKRPVLTKDGLFDLSVDVVIVGDDYNVLCQLADDIEDHFDGEEHFEYESTDPGVNPDDFEEFNISIKYNLKMIK